MTSLRYRRSVVLSRAFAGQVVLAAPEGETFEVLSGTAGTVWQVLDAPLLVQEIIQLLADAYGASPGAITPDVERLLEDLVARGYLEVEESAGV